MASDTPKTDALIARHEAEVADADRECLRELAVAQVKELLAHTRNLEQRLAGAQNLLSDIHDFLLPQEDADCVDGAFVPNRAMHFVQEIEAALAVASGTPQDNAEAK